MKRYLLDSNAVNAFVNRHETFAMRVAEASARGDRIGTCEPIIAELYHGLELSSSRDRNIARLERTLSQIVCWPFERSSSKAYGRIAADLKRRGRIIQTIDMMLAAVALTLPNGVVITTDSDLLVIPGLRVEDWTKLVQLET